MGGEVACASTRGCPTQEGAGQGGLLLPSQHTQPHVPERLGQL